MFEGQNIIKYKKKDEIDIEVQRQQNAGNSYYAKYVCQYQKSNMPTSIGIHFYVLTPSLQEADKDDR